MDRTGTLILAGAALALGVALRTWWWTAVVPLVWIVTAFGSLRWRIAQDGERAVTARWDVLVPVRRVMTRLFSSEITVIQFDGSDIVSLAAIAAAPFVAAAALGLLIGNLLLSREGHRDWRPLLVIAAIAGAGVVFTATIDAESNVILLILPAAALGAILIRSWWACALIPLGFSVVYLARESWRLLGLGLTGYEKSMRPCGFIEFFRPCDVSEVLSQATVWPLILGVPFAALGLVVGWVIRRIRVRFA